MNAKKLTLVLILIVILSALTACGSSDNVKTTTVETSALAADYEDALPPRTQLIVGILQLEGTDQQVNLEQARQLLPLVIVPVFALTTPSATLCFIRPFNVPSTPAIGKEL